MALAGKHLLCFGLFFLPRLSNADTPNWAAWTMLRASGSSATERGGERWSDQTPKTSQSFNGLQEPPGAPQRTADEPQEVGRVVKHSHFSFTVGINLKVFLCFCQEGVAGRKERTPEGLRKEEVGTKGEGEQGSGRGKEEQIPTSSRAVETASEARKGLHRSASIFHNKSSQCLTRNDLRAEMIASDKNAQYFSHGSLTLVGNAYLCGASRCSAVSHWRAV